MNSMYATIRAERHQPAVIALKYRSTLPRVIGRMIKDDTTLVIFRRPSTCYQIHCVGRIIEIALTPPTCLKATTGVPSGLSRNPVTTLHCSPIQRVRKGF